MADIHVAINGNDANPGTIASPKKTPQGAHSAASPGDNIIYHGGTYYIVQEQNINSPDGTAGNYITHKPYVSGGVTENVIFSGISGSSANPLGRLTGATIPIFDMGDFVIIDGISWNGINGNMIVENNAAGRGISVGDDSIVKNVIVRGMGERSIGGGQHRVIVQNNHVYNGGLAHISGSPSAWPGGISPFSLGTGVLATNWTITGNYVHDHWGEGIIALRVSGCSVIGNVVHDCYSVGIYVDKAKVTTVDSNYVFYTNPGYNKSGERMKLFNNACEGNSLRCTNTEIIHRNNIGVGGEVAFRWFQASDNTSQWNQYAGWHIYNNLAWGQVSYAVDFDNVVAPAPEPSGCTMQNNIFFKGSNNDTISVADTAAWTWKNNIFADFTSPGYATGVSSFQNTNPNLVNPVLSGSANGFALPYTSIANRAGIHIAANTLDFFGKTRNNPPTIGPYEIPAKPTGTNDAYTVNRGSVLTQGASPSGVLLNDYLGMSGTLLGYTAASTQGGTVYISGSGAFVYTPPANFFGSDTFTYSILGMGGTGTAIVTVTVNNIAPVPVDDNYQTAKNVVYQTGAAGGLFANDALNSGTLAGYDAVTTRGGSAYVSGSGAFRYTPPTDAYGGVPDSFRYTLQNSIGTGTATVYITITNVAPVPSGDSFTTIKTAVFSSGGLFANDVLNSGTLLGYDAVTTRAGTAYVSGVGYFTYTPPAGVYGGAADTFRYSLQNSAGTGVATVSITLINVPPVLAADSYNANQDTVLTQGAAGGLFTNDVLNSGTLHGYNAATTLGGVVYVSGSGAFRYTPPASVFSPPSDTFMYTVINNVGSGTATVSISIASSTPAGSPSGTSGGLGSYERYRTYWKLRRLG